MVSLVVIWIFAPGIVKKSCQTLTERWQTPPDATYLLHSARALLELPWLAPTQPSTPRRPVQTWSSAKIDASCS